MYTLFRERRLRFLDYVRQMEDGCILKDILYGELAFGKKCATKDVCKEDMKGLDRRSE